MKCPECKNDDTLISTQYQKAPLWRILKFSCLIIAIILLACVFYEVIVDVQTANSAQIKQSAFQFTAGVIDNQTNAGETPSAIARGSLPPATFGWFIIFLILATIFYGIQTYKERQIIAVYTCKKCGNTWIKKN